tara:strand:+ start:604 stop:762 length:159 start_codon:yes stop_codon:yes gene_type:complete
MPKHRLFDMRAENPLSDSYLNGSHDSENSLREFLGYESDSEEEKEPSSVRRS